MLFGLWRIARARKAVTAALQPMVRASEVRCGTISGRCWTDPYIIGFLSMLITLMTRSLASDRLSDDGLALLQLDVWAALSGVADTGIGERILSLSANEDEAFVEGCRCAAEFHQVWELHPSAQSGPYEEALFAGHSHESIVDTATVGEGLTFQENSGPDGVMEEMWVRLFDSHITN